MAVTAVASLGAVSALLQALPANNALLGFTGVRVSSLDQVVVPVGYMAKVLIAWGNPVSDGPTLY